MLNFRTLTIAIAAVLMSTVTHGGDLGSAFTYQGELEQSGVGVNDNCDFSFGLWDAPAGGTMLGQDDLFNVQVAEGTFTVELDFGGGVFEGQSHWLEIAVDCPAGGGEFVMLSPRQELTPAPNALFSETAATVDWSGLTNVPAGLDDGDDVDDADADPNNEIQDLELAGNMLTLTGDATPVDLSGLIVDTDDQTLEEVLTQGNDAALIPITNLASPTAPGDAATKAYVDAHTDGDGDDTNELQNLFATVNGDAGSTTADAQADTLTVVGSGTVSTEVAGDTLTITGSGITSDVRDPVLTGSLAIGGFPTSVYISGRYAYVVDQDSDDLKIIDVTEPTAPTEVGSLAIGPGIPSGVFVAGRYAYVVDEDTDDLKVIDVSNPSAPSLISSTALTPAAALTDVFIAGHYAYLTDNLLDELRIVDISDPVAPTEIGSAVVGNNSQSVFVSGRYAYVADTSSLLYIFDVSVPSAPSLAGSLPLDGPVSVYVSGRYAYVTDTTSNELLVIDVSDPSAPVEVGSLGFGNQPEDVYVSGDYAYIARAAGLLSVIDISDPTTPNSVSDAQIGNPGAHSTAVHVSGRYAYVVDRVDDDLKVVDVSGVELPSVIAHSLEAGNLQVRNDVIAQGQLQVAGGVNVGTGGVFTDGNVGLSGTLAIANDIAPTGSPANLVQLYAEDAAASSELKVRDEAGNITTLSPHNFSLIGKRSEPMAWSFYSENALGRINVDMLRTVRLVEQLSGQKLVFTQLASSLKKQTETQVEAIGLDTSDQPVGHQTLPAELLEVAASKDAEIIQLRAENQAILKRLEQLEQLLACPEPR